VLVIAVCLNVRHIYGKSQYWPLVTNKLLILVAKRTGQNHQPCLSHSPDVDEMVTKVQVTAVEQRTSHKTKRLYINGQCSGDRSWDRHRSGAGHCSKSARSEQYFEFV